MLSDIELYEILVELPEDELWLINDEAADILDNDDMRVHIMESFDDYFEYTTPIDIAFLIHEGVFNPEEKYFQVGVGLWSSNNLLDFINMDEIITLLQAGHDFGRIALTKAIAEAEMEEKV